MDIIELEQEVDENNRKIAELIEAKMTITRRRGDYDYGDPRRNVLAAEIAAKSAEITTLQARQRECREQIDGYYDRLYERPTGPIASKFSGLPGPLPEGMQALEFTDEMIAEAPRFRILPLLSIVAALVVGVAVVLVFPDAVRIGLLGLLPTSTDADAKPGPSASEVIINAVLASLFVYHWLKHHARMRRASYGIAIEEELRFRSGAENWTPTRRVLGILGYASARLLTLVAPLIFVPAFATVGAILMVVYLREYRRTGSTKQATYASARFGAAGKQATLALITIWFIWLTISSIFSYFS